MSAEANQRAVSELSNATARSVAEQWRQVDPEAASVSWGARLAGVAATVTTAQIAAAALANGTLVAGIVTTRVNAAAFGGSASDGRPLASLLFQPAIALMAAMSAGALPAAALATGAAVLDMIVRTQVADANRAATGVAVTATPTLIGYERVVHLPACGRCIILAGKVYRWSQGFLRHPRCDCTMRPVTREQYRTANLDNHPRALFERMSREQQDKKLGKAGAQAIRDGADLSQVVNARSGMATAVVGGRRVQTTTSGATRRGLAGQRLGARRGGQSVRLMPESIYQLASSRDEAIRLLHQHGYIL